MVQRQPVERRTDEEIARALAVSVKVVRRVRREVEAEVRPRSDLV